MSIDILIKPKGLFKKPYPFEVIVGDELSYGVYEAGSRLAVGERGDEIALFRPSRIARGFTVTRLRGHALALRALHPTTEGELRDLYGTVERILGYCDATLTVDGVRTSLDAFLGGFSEALDFNARILRDFAERKRAEEGSITLFSAKWPLAFGSKEAEAVLADPATFASWLHEKQAINAYFAVPKFCSDPREGTFGIYALPEGCRSIFPQKPSVPFEYADPATGLPLSCDRFELLLYSTTRTAGIGTIPYDRFFALLDPAKVSYYDADAVLIKPLTLSEMEDLLARAAL